MGVDGGRVLLSNHCTRFFRFGNPGAIFFDDFRRARRGPLRFRKHRVYLRKRRDFVGTKSGAFGKRLI